MATMYLLFLFVSLFSSPCYADQLSFRVNHMDVKPSSEHNVFMFEGTVGEKYEVMCIDTGIDTFGHKGLFTLIDLEKKMGQAREFDWELKYTILYLNRGQHNFTCSYTNGSDEDAIKLVVTGISRPRLKVSNTYFRDFAYAKVNQNCTIHCVSEPFGTLEWRVCNSHGCNWYNTTNILDNYGGYYSQEIPIVEHSEITCMYISPENAHYLTNAVIVIDKNSFSKELEQKCSPIISPKPCNPESYRKIDDCGPISPRRYKRKRIDPTTITNTSSEKSVANIYETSTSFGNLNPVQKSSSTLNSDRHHVPSGSSNTESVQKSLSKIIADTKFVGSGSSHLNSGQKFISKNCILLTGICTGLLILIIIFALISWKARVRPQRLVEDNSTRPRVALPPQYQTEVPIYSYDCEDSTYSEVYDHCRGRARRK